MPGDHQRLSDALDRLQTQLEAVRKLDPNVAAHLDATIAEAKALAGGPSANTPAHRSIAARLRDAALKFEASHPALAAQLEGLIDALGQAGI